MRDQSIGDYLGDLADRIPAPGGGAASALHAAQAAALIAMVARYSDGARYDTALMSRVISEADALRERSLALAAADAEAFEAVSAAYKVPKDEPDRKDLIASALSGAARPPAELIDVASRLVSLAEELVPAGNRNLIADVAAAAAAAMAAAITARVNIEVNLRGTTDPSAALADDIVARAERVVTAVRGEITS
ncbi:MAG TPA: cyclodeaminase/cyclohydrolase family protein [Streptosporangiaceae bacterium]|jgi:formiminotetrahydrofolate cyclodeaminase